MNFEQGLQQLGDAARAKRDAAIVEACRNQGLDAGLMLRFADVCDTIVNYRILYGCDPETGKINYPKEVQG